MQTLKTQIIDLLEQGLDNATIVARLGCAPSYPSLLRRQLGMPTAHNKDRGVRDQVVAQLLRDSTQSNLAIGQAIGCATAYVWRIRKSLGLANQHVAEQVQMMARFSAKAAIKTPHKGRKPMPAPLRDTILAYMVLHPYDRVNDVAQALGVRPDTVSKAKTWARRQEQAACGG